MTQPLTDLREPLNVLWTGDGGTGKTTAMAAMAKFGKVVLVNGESGIKSRALKRRGIPVENIEIFPGPGEELSFDGLEALWKQMREELHEDPDAYVGIGWDPVTEVQQAFAEAEAAESTARAMRTGRERNRFVKDRDNWNIANGQLRLMIRRFRDLPIHFGMTALLRREQDEQDGTVTYQPNVTPGMQNDIYGWMDLVCVTFMEEIDGEEEYCGLFRPLGKYRGKGRDGGAIPRWLVDPTFDRCYAYDNEDLDVESDPVQLAARERRERTAGAAETATNEKKTTSEEK